jgi:phenylacetate-CoA ligase
VIFTSPACSGNTCSAHASRDDRILLEHTLFLPTPRNPFDLEEVDVARALDEMHGFAPDLLLAHPVYLAELTKRAARYGRRFPELGAILSSYQYFSHCQRRVLRRHFDAPIFALYSATELGGSQVAIGCHHGNLHVRLDHVFVELRRGGASVQPGDLGSVTVTSHHPTMPLVRYDVGDLARFDLTPCPCSVGSAWPVLTLEGRELDAFHLPDRRVTTRDVDECLKDVELEMYQLCEHAPRRYCLYVVPGAAGAWRRQTEALLVPLLEPQELTVEEVSELRMEDYQKFRFT